MSAEITVLMPNYNNEPFLREAIDSILNQTLKNFIFLIVDDGSTDKGLEIINSYKDPRIKLIVKEKNSGIVDTLNIGLADVDTKYFVRMDGDDISTPDRLELLYNFMEENPHIGACGSNIETFGNSKETWKYQGNSDKLTARLIFHGAIGHASSIFRTEILKRNNVMYSKQHPYMEDYQLFSELKQYTQFANIDKTLYYYRILNHNSTVKNKNTYLDRYRNFYKNVLNELGIPSTEKNIELHLEFFIKTTLSYKTIDYKNLIDLIISNNRIKKNYPTAGLEELLKEKWENFFYKTVSSGTIATLNYFIVSKKITLNQVTYLLKYQVNKILGRN